MLAFILHIGGGATGLISGTVAAFARKGGTLHRRAGTIFVVSMLIMSILAIYLAVAEPDQLTNVFIGAFSIYLISTGWMAVRRKDDNGLPNSLLAANSTPKCRGCGFMVMLQKRTLSASVNVRAIGCWNTIPTRNSSNQARPLKRTRALQRINFSLREPPVAECGEIIRTYSMRRKLNCSRRH
jgi:hypothetical protein